jgi:hypothetical protein
MRKVSGFVLILLGALAVAAAILVPTAVLHHYKKTPLNIDVTQVSSGTAQLLDTKTMQLQKVPVRSTRTVKTDGHASDGKYTTLDEKLCTVVVQGPTPACLPISDPRYLSTTTDRVTSDRRTAESVHVARYAESVNGDRKVEHVGLTYKWPIDTQKQTYRYFFSDLGRAFPATYQGTEKVAGLTTYKFVSQTGVQPYQVPTPAGLVPGSYEDRTTVWVEPETGAIINGTERQILKIINPVDPSGPKLTAIDVSLSFDKAAINDAAGEAKHARRLLDVAEFWAPLGLGVIALAAFVGAYFLLRPRRKSGGDDRQRLDRIGGPAPENHPDHAEPPVPAGSSGG